MLHWALRNVKIPLPWIIARTLRAARPDFTAHLLGGPKFEDFQITRDQDTGRPIDL